MRHSPSDAPELARIVAAAAAANQPLAAWAGASKRSLCTNPAGAIVLDISRLKGVVDYQPTELVMTARAATPLHEIEAALEAQGQMLAFEPPDWRALLGTQDRHQTLGGIVACNLSGPRRVAAGAARDHFLGVQAVNGRGELFKAGGKVVKNVTGYDLCKLLAGSWGTLAVMTEVTVKVMPRPETSLTVVRSGLSDAEAVRLMTASMNSAHEVSAAAHLPAALAPAGRALTALRLEGSRPSLKARSEALCRELSGEFLDEVESQAFWAGIREVGPFVGCDGPVWRLSVPPACASRVTAAISATVSCRWFYDWGGGLIWLCIEPALPDGGAAAIRVALVEGGHATLLRASPDLRGRIPNFQPLPTPLAALNARVKQAFDPAGILNPGCLNRSP